MKINAKDILNHHGLKYSKPRELILNALSQYQAPISVEELYDGLKENNHNINLSTIYRSVEAFSDHHIIEKIYSSVTNTYLIQLKHQHHQHYLVCINCHKMIPIDYCPMDEFLAYIKKHHDFKVMDHQLEISGYCHDCQATQSGF